MSEPNGLEQCCKTIENKKLRLGYTTGSCAAAAAKAAAGMLLTGEDIDYVNLTTPGGYALHLKVLDKRRGVDFVSCAVQKDAGDDPDVTDGIWIYARVSTKKADRTPKQPFIVIRGGTGVGTVTKPGLEQPVGAAAINRVPRQMICRELEQLCGLFQNEQGLEVEISAPGGEQLAEKTFNPRLGISGGISILGTTGIVEPMSESALISSIRLEIRQQTALGQKSLLVTPGNYGQAFLEEHFPLQLADSIKCSNFVGETIDIAADAGVENILFVAHIGKFIKVAGGIFQTHSRNADARMEILTANAVLAGAGQPLLTELMRAVTTEEGIRILEEAGILRQTMKHVTERVQFHLARRGAGRIHLGAVLFSSELAKRRQGSGELGRTENASEILEKILIETA
ncbi:MAG: cobalamin biosynthesis protein CbiD [Lachnospiraceae bacterium]|nr:cobalamin biosynthesis protein CbiD [Lachnospiraceae bacterium]